MEVAGIRMTFGPPSQPEMQMLAAFFWLLTLMTCVFAVCFGGRDGRWFTMIFIAVSYTHLTLPTKRIV